MTAAIRVSASGLVKDRSGRRVLDGVELSAAAGQLVGTGGPSGSGKTTLLMILAGLLEPDEGGVELAGGTNASGGQPRVGFVPQSLGLAPMLTAAENVAIVLQLQGIAPEEIARRTMALMDTLGLGATHDRVVTELSGGQRQRVAVARALVAAPDILIADEPTAEVDAENRRLILKLLREAAEAGATVIVATHDPEVIDSCDDAYELREGRLVR
ncbi:MAG: ATP-binding cassette domain-containing protein [Acidimicrobiales bacterium]